MNLFEELFCMPLCFEGDEPTDEQPEPQEAPADESLSRSFTQEDVNKFLAEDRRKHQERYKALETSYQKALKNQQLDNGERNRLEQELADLQASFRTKEQQIEYERKQAAVKFENELKEQQARAERWEKMYKEEKIDRSILDACGPDVFHPKQILDMMRPKAQLKEEMTEDGRPTGRLVTYVTLDDIDEKTGEPIQTLRTPADAVNRMKELPKLYGNQFRSNVVSGVGAGAADAGPGAAGKIDPTKLTPEQYRKLRLENPEVLGLAGRRRR